MTWLLNLLSGGLLGTIDKFLDGLARARSDAMNAQTDEARIAAEKEQEFFRQQIALAQTAAQADKWWSTRELIGKCALIYVFKIVVWDSVLKLGVTPDPGPQVTGIVMLVIGFYFGSKAATDIAGRLIAGLGARR